MQLARTNQSIVVISDLHLDTWPRGNPDKSKDFRMKVQPHKLAERISRVMAEENTEYLFILGDIINEWTAEPQVMEVLVDFYKTLISQYPYIKIRYILGQHDMHLYDVFTEENSYVHLVARMFPENVEYVHDKILNINNTSIYCSSYCRKGIIYPKYTVDVMLSHITFGKDEVDTDAASLIVAGDIHDFYDEGNCHSVGTPFQLYAHQPKRGVIGLIKLNGNHSKFSRLSSDSSDFEFLKFDPLERVTKSEVALNVAASSSDIAQYNESELLKMIDEEVKAHGVEAVHERIDIQKAPAAIDFRYQLSRIVIDNVRSIDHLELDLANFIGITYVSGPTGSGKSSIFWSIEAALTGAGGTADLLRKTNSFTGKPLRIQLWLTYDGQEYYIDRTAKALTLKVNGEDLTEAKTKTQKKLEELLPFVKYWKFFHIHAGSHYFESIDRVELLQVLFNLGIFTYLYSQGKEILKVDKKSIKECSNDISQLEGVLSARTEDIVRVRDKLQALPKPEIPEEDLNQSIERGKTVYGAFTNAKNELLICSERCDNAKSAIKGTVVPLDSQIKEWNDKLITLREKLKIAASENEKYEKAKSRVVYFDSRVSALKSTAVTKCPHCGGILKGPSAEEIAKAEEELFQAKKYLEKLDRVSTEELHNSMRKVEADLRNADESLRLKKNLELAESRAAKAQAAFDEAQETLDSFLKEHDVSSYDEFSKRVSEVRLQYQEIHYLEKEFNRISNEIKNFEGRKIELDKRLADLQASVEMDTKYVSLFDMQFLDSIPYSILKKLVAYLTTDSIKFKTDTGDEDNPKFEVSCSLRVGDKWIYYEDASDGQKNYLDMYILIRITKFLGGVGLLILDEPLSNMDPKYVAKASELIPEIIADTLFVSSHTLINGYDRIIRVSQNSKELTEVEL